jgi:hypothetical protein
VGVITAGGIGLPVVSGRVAVDAFQPLNAPASLGLGFVASSMILFAISQGLGLIELTSSELRTETPGAFGTGE